MNVIQLENLSKVFSTSEMSTQALRDINLEIKKGEYVSISGPSGSGKSTLLSILGLLDKASSGTYKIEGVEVNGLSLSKMASIRNEYIGFVFQQFNLLNEFSVYDNVAMPLLYGSSSTTSLDIKMRVRHCLDLVNLGNRINHKPIQLSGGQQQRVAIARALVKEPSILLVDEPTGNLDSKNGDQIMGLLKKLNDNGSTIILVTHDQRYAECANRKLVLKDGSMVSNETAFVKESLLA